MIMIKVLNLGLFVKTFFVVCAHFERERVQEDWYFAEAVSEWGQCDAKRCMTVLPRRSVELCSCDTEG